DSVLSGSPEVLPDAEDAFFALRVTLVLLVLSLPRPSILIRQRRFDLAELLHDLSRKRLKVGANTVQIVPEIHVVIIRYLVVSRVCRSRDAGETVLKFLGDDTHDGGD
ncbi:hypothetical protein OJ920_10430, partial [Streptococcus anginosus]